MTSTPVALIKSFARKLSRRLGYEIHRVPRRSGGPEHETVHPQATYAPWNKDQVFLETLAAVASHTLVDKYRCYELWTLTRQSHKLRGSILEVGVWRGGTGAIIARQAKSCGIADPVYLCDTFTGVPKAGPQDSHYRGGEHADTSRKIVERLVYDRLGLDNVRILEGVFPDQTCHLIAADAFRLCHVDVDVYQSAKDIVDWVWDRLVVGGIVVYDDYGTRDCDGITRHVEEQEALPDRLLIRNLNGHAVVIKIGTTAGRRAESQRV